MKKLISFVSLFIAFAFANCSSDDNVYKQGKILYTRLCANCHQEQGEGVRGLIPPLAKSDYLVKYRHKLACIIQKGQKGDIVVNGTTYGTQEMLAISNLTEFEVANILNYVSTSWGNAEKIWTVDEVRETLKKCD